MAGAFSTTITGAMSRKPGVKLGVSGGILGADGLVGEPEDFNICYDINSFLVSSSITGAESAVAAGSPSTASITATLTATSNPSLASHQALWRG